MFEVVEGAYYAFYVVVAAVDVVWGVFWDHVFEVCETVVWVKVVSLNVVSVV